MSNHKIVITGPVGAGKTTAVSTLSDIEPVQTDAVASDMTAQRKRTTTVAMDYGRLDLGGGEHVHLYGTPGQERFDFMWEILCEGCIGLVLLVDNSRPAPLNDLSFFLKSFVRQIRQTRFVIGVTHMDKAPNPGLPKYHEILNKLEFNVPIFEVDARSEADMRTLLKALLYSLDPGLMEPARGVQA
ncbi:MAG: ATP/GTP-binding protein [Betaproteobacteria bacterium]|nr:ATP/GTP-binding protein [Betaproteobacteria bacterium]